MDEKESKRFVENSLRQARETGAIQVVNDLVNWIGTQVKITKRGILTFISNELKKISKGDV